MCGRRGGGRWRRPSSCRRSAPQPPPPPLTLELRIATAAAAFLRERQGASVVTAQATSRVRPVHLARWFMPGGPTWSPSVITTQHGHIGEVSPVYLLYERDALLHAKLVLAWVGASVLHRHDPGRIFEGSKRGVVQHNGGGFVTAHDRWVAESRINPTSRSVDEHKVIPRSLHLAVKPCTSTTSTGGGCCYTMRAGTMSVAPTSRGALFHGRGQGWQRASRASSAPMWCRSSCRWQSSSREGGGPNRRPRPSQMRNPSSHRRGKGRRT